MIYWLCYAIINFAGVVKLTLRCVNVLQTDICCKIKTVVCGGIGYQYQYTGSMSDVAFPSSL